MLTKLLESRAHQARYTHFMVASATVHIILIYAATSATIITAKAKQESLDPVLHWVPMPKPVDAPRVSLPNEITRLASALPRRSFNVPVEIPSSLPSIDLNPVAVDPSEFSRSPSGASLANDPAPSGSSVGDGRRAYDVSEVETAVTAIGNTIPDYPPALRAAGVEGTVSAEFVVTESGRADPRSLRIVSATNDAFVESIRRALPRMRFTPARIGGRAVAQLVQQQFVFRLDR